MLKHNKQSKHKNRSCANDNESQQNISLTFLGYINNNNQKTPIIIQGHITGYPKDSLRV